MTSVAAQSNGRRKVQVQDLPLGDSDAQACPRPRAREEETTPAATVRDLPLKRHRWAGGLPAAVSAVFTGASLLHTKPASLAEAHTRHLQSAGAFRRLVLRWPRLAWGYLVHLPVKAVSHVLDWVLESPVRALVAALLITAAWIWH
jgi:hypothetical protein